MTDYYNALATKMPQTKAAPQPSPLRDFIHAYSMVCTRAFLIDLWHTIALCPFADLFNHSSTQAHTSLSADDFVCHVCGSLAACPHDIASSSGVVRRLEHLPESELRRLESEPDTVDLRVDRRAISAGEQVFNSYGDDMGDARLLVEWGFVEEDSAEVRVSFDIDELGPGFRIWNDLHESVHRFASSAPPEHEDSLIRLSTGDNIFEIDPDGKFSIHLFASVLFGVLGPEKSSLRQLKSAAVYLERWAATEEIDRGSLEAEGPMVDTGRAILGLLDRRLGALYGGQGGIEQLFAEREVGSF